MKCRFHPSDDAVWMIALGRLSDMHTETMPVCDWCASSLRIHKQYAFQLNVWTFDEYMERKLDNNPVIKSLPKRYQTRKDDSKMQPTPDQAKQKQSMQTRMLPSLWGGKTTGKAKHFFQTPRSRQARSR